MFTAGIVANKEDIISIETKQESVNRNTKNRNLSSGEIDHVSSIIEIEPQFQKMPTTGMVKPENLKINPSIIYKLIAEMQEKAVFFKLSGGVHSCALASEAVTDSALEMAYDNDITLMGFARGERMDVYTHVRRIAI